MDAEQTWAAVDAYVTERLLGADPDLEAALAASDRAGLPQIAVSPPQGMFLHLLARAVGARRILEIGTLGGYSTIWLARSLPAGGRLVSLELDPHHAEVAGQNLARAGLDGTAEIRVGPASESLASMTAGGEEPFDLTFIDADKERVPEYFEAAVGLSRPGGLIVVDNVVRAGALASDDSSDGRVAGVRRFHEMLAGRSDVAATTLQTVGSKGYDGFTMVLVGPAQNP